MAIKIGKIISFKNRQQFRQWLQKNYNKKGHLWVLFYKKHLNKPGLTLAEAVEEALCYGWIDGILKSIDSKKHVIRFTPRRPGSYWSKHNLNRVIKLIRQKKMRRPGRATLPKELLAKLAKDKKRLSIPKNRQLSNTFGIKIY